MSATLEPDVFFYSCTEDDRMRIEHLPEETLSYSQAFETVSEFFSEKGKSRCCLCACRVFMVFEGLSKFGENGQPFSRPLKCAKK